MVKELVDLIERCEKCSGLFIDKPCIKHGVYCRFMPSRPLVLVVSESPPYGRKEDYLYNLNHRDNLRKALAEVLNVDEKAVIDYLVSNHILWTTAIKCRPKEKSYLERMRRNCLDVLRFEVSVLKPEVIVALGRTAIKSFKDIGVQPTLTGLHPLYYKRIRRLDELKRIFEKVFNVVKHKC